MSYSENRHFLEIAPAPAGSGPATMSSVEIAELCGKEHKHVIRQNPTTLSQI